MSGAGVVLCANDQYSTSVPTRLVYQISPTCHNKICGILLAANWRRGHLEGPRIWPYLCIVHVPIPHPSLCPSTSFFGSPPMQGYHIQWMELLGPFLKREKSPATSFYTTPISVQYPPIPTMLEPHTTVPNSPFGQLQYGHYSPTYPYAIQSPTTPPP